MSNRRGMDVNIIGVIIMLVVGILVGLWLYNKFSGESVKQIDDLQACGGVLGALGGGEGRCMEDKTCRGLTASEANALMGGKYYWQYVGDFGCNRSTGGKEPACCIQLPETANPLRAGDVNRVKCSAELQQGEWALQKGIECIKMNSSMPAISVAADQELVFIHKPRDNEQACKLYIQFVQGIPLTISNAAADQKGCFNARNSEGVVLIPTSVIGYMDEMLKTYGDTLKFDASQVNTRWTLQGELRSSQTTAFTLSVTNPNNRFYCSPAASDFRCANVRVGARDKNNYGTCQLSGGGAKCVTAP